MRKFVRCVAAALLCAPVVVVSSASFAGDLVFGNRPVAWTPSRAPAVDGVNGKADLFGGSVAREGIVGGMASVSVPLGGQYGAQLDGLLSSYDGKFLGGIGGHVFWRDPSRGLVGLYASHVHHSRLGGVHSSRIAPEAALYWGRWTFEGMAGVEWGNRTSAVVNGALQTVDIKTRFFDSIDAAYYWNDDLKLKIGHRYYGGKHALALGGEYGFPVRGFGPGTMAGLFGEARLGDRSSVWGGIRFYFGRSEKSLMRRHREDDPPGALVDDAAAIGNNPGSSTAQAGAAGGCPPGTISNGLGGCNNL